MLVIRKRGDCDNYERNKESKKSDWPDFWNKKYIWVIHTQIGIESLIIV